jgi:hypothetical protein
MPNNSTRNAHCNNCGGQKNHAIHNKIVKQWSEKFQGEDIYGEDTYILAECLGCNSIKLIHESWFSEDCDSNGYVNVHERYYPSSIFRQSPRWLTLLNSQLTIKKLLKEIYQALQNDAPSLAAMGIRAAIETIMVEKAGDQGTFSKNLNEFESKGYISKVQLKILETTLEIGHASIHRGFTPKTEHLEVAIDAIESLVHRLYLLEQRAKETDEVIPKRNP